MRWPHMCPGGQRFGTSGGLRSVLTQTLIVATLLSVPAWAAKVNKQLWSKVTDAKSIYIENQTGNPKVLEAATEQFSEWGRFAIAKSEKDADLTIVFTHKSGMDKWGNLGFIEMDVFPKGENSPAFKVKKASRLIWEPQRRTINCIGDFEKRLQRKHHP